MHENIDAQENEEVDTNWGIVMQKRRSQYDNSTTGICSAFLAFTEEEINQLHVEIEVNAWILVTEKLTVRQRIIQNIAKL